MGNYITIKHKNTIYRDLNKILGLNKVETKIGETFYPIETQEWLNPDYIANPLGKNMTNIYSQIFWEKSDKKVHIDRYGKVVSTIFDMNPKTDKEKIIYSYLKRLLPMIPDFINDIMIPTEREINDINATNGLEFDNSLASIELFTEKREVKHQDSYQIRLEYDFIKENYMKSIGITPNFVSNDIAKLGLINLINFYVDKYVFDTSMNSVEDVISHIMTELVSTIICTNFANIWNAFSENKVKPKDFKFDCIHIIWNEYISGTFQFNIILHTNIKPNFKQFNTAEVFVVEE